MPSHYDADSLARLSFDFESIGGPKGTIPEPTEEAFRAFCDAIESADSLAEQFEAAAEMCQGAITRDQLAALPPRHQVAFLQYLVGEFMRPRLAVRVAGILQKQQAAVDEVVVRHGAPVVDVLELSEDAIRRYVARPLTRAFSDGAQWAQRELLEQLAQAGFVVVVDTVDDIARGLISQLDSAPLEG